ncbi:polar amino acid transport system permease protein [Lachnospiraceae bacterium]|nr:polar amino acid transport system permease protein [Lachnospiraceae bacterium]
MTIGEKFTAAFITEDRWQLYLKGLGITVEIALFAAIIGLVLGTVLALMKLSTTRNGKPSLVNYIATAYVDIIRGTPSVLQLLIMWFIVLKSSNNGVLVASLSFGLNSAAYVSEIVRGGILAVDNGQMEAGRSLGLTKAMTMRYIVLPQAMKNIIPPMGNEFITLLKETAIVGYVSLNDLTRAANLIQSRTYEAFMPLIGAAVIYFAVIKVLTLLLGVMERRLRRSDNR